MTTSIADIDLEAYLDEALPTEAMAQIERALRDQPALIKRLSAINARRDAGVHSVGELWRASRVSCPTRDQLGSYLLSVLDDALADYITFHVETVGCRFCGANLDDLRSQSVATSGDVETRRRKYFQSSAGYLPKKA